MLDKIFKYEKFIRQNGSYLRRLVICVLAKGVGLHENAGIGIIACIALCAAVWQRSAEVGGVTRRTGKSRHNRR